MAGVLVISKVKLLHPQYQKRFEELGFEDVALTNARLDALNTVIDEKQPRLIFIGSGFYQAGTPYMTGQMMKQFPDINIAAVSLNEYPMSLAPWFIWHGATSYLNLWEGYDEFHRGLKLVREGKPYISPTTKELIDHCKEWPKVDNNLTNRELECLIMLCCGFTLEAIGKELGITRLTINRHLVRLYNIFHVNCREGMVALAWELELVTKNDLQFYYDKMNERTFVKKPTPPDWAVIKKKCDTYLTTRGIT